MNDNVSTIQPIPNEEYIFNYTTDELDKLFRVQRKSAYTKPVVCIILLIIIIVYGITVPAGLFYIGLSVGVLIFTVIFYAKGFHAFNKACKTNAPKIIQNTYEYKIYDNYFILNIYRKGERLRQSKCYFEEIQQIQKLDKWLLLQFGGQAFILRESDLKENSMFYSYIGKNTTNKK